MVAQIDQVDIDEHLAGAQAGGRIEPVESTIVPAVGLRGRGDDARRMPAIEAAQVLALVLRERAIGPPERPWRGGRAAGRRREGVGECA